MKIKYEFVTGIVEVEITNEWAGIIADMDRLEYNNQKKETRRHYSIDACTYEGKSFEDDCDILRDIILKEENYELKKAIDKLQPQQKQLLIRVWQEGEKLSEIAASEGVSKMAITNRMKKIYKKLKEILK
jgi:RNA polymerase sigma factor (sigma-70 family)|nr:MAG TPA: CadC-like protein [Caudoviricetes sp.]